MKSSRERGSVLLITLVFVIMLSMMAISVLELSNNSYRLTMRNQLQAEARAVAESELEYLLYEFKFAVVSGAATGADTAPALLATTANPTGAAIADNTALPDKTTTRPPFLVAHQNAGWRVRRSIILDRGPINGRIPGTTKVGDFTYVIARIEVLPPASNPFAASTASVRVGRRFINSNTSIFQYSVFFQGDLELNPGKDTTINGDVVANGSIYMGPRSGFDLILNGKVRYLADHFFNATAAGTTTYSNPDAPTPPVTLVAPTFATSQASQLETLSEPENLLGGIDVTVTAQDRPDLFGPPGRTDPSAWTEAEQAEAENNVYRSLIVPPPTNAGANEYPNGSSGSADDSVISVRRAYSRAGLIVTVDTDNTVTFTKVQDGTATDVTSTFVGAGVLSDLKVAPSTTTTYVRDMTDAREGKAVEITQIDVANLKTALDNLAGSFDFNGLVYVNLKGSSSTHPSAVRLVNGGTLPASAGVGFSVATNGGLYVQGSYNTGNVTDPDGTSRHPAAMLIADAITVLSSEWDDANAALDIAHRTATLSTAEQTAGDGGTPLVQINAGLLTGNVAATASASSGGAQNLVRYLEDWSGKTIRYFGSIGRLFASTQFIAGYTGPGSVYVQPENRNFDFDSNMLKHRPPGTPTTTAFSRGSFFTWQYP